VLETIFMQTQDKVSAFSLVLKYVSSS